MTLPRFILVVCLTALVFAAGYEAGRWRELHQPLPPPPGPLMGEFGDHRSGPRSLPTQINRAEFMAEVEKLHPQIEQFRRQMDEIYDQFERELDPILTPGQRTLHAARLKRRAEFRSANEKWPLNDKQLVHIMQWANAGMFRIVTLQMGLEDLDRELKLEASQRDQVLKLLSRRRDRFLALIDRTPPPSLALIHLAPYAERLAPPDAPRGDKPVEKPASQP